MVRTVARIAAVAVMAFASACGSTVIGDPCLPVHPSATAGQLANSDFGPDAGFFVASEVYIETRSLQCSTRVCLVYHWDEANQLDQRSNKVFCTCRCDMGTDNPCVCPSAEFTCTSVFTTGSPSVRGSYCIRNGLVPDAAVSP